MAELNPELNDLPEPVEPVEVAHVLVTHDRPRKVSASMWGPFEIAAVSIGAIAIVAAVFAYFFFVIPSTNELARNKADADRLEAELVSAKSKYGDITNTETQVEKLVASVDDFETRFLPIPTTGQSALYQRLNGLIAAYDLTNTTGPDYSPLEATEAKAGEQTDEEKGRAKYRSLYPGVYVSTTLEGTYQNLRRFIREIETGRDFVIVSAVELAPTDTEKKSDEKRPNGSANVMVINPGNPNMGQPNPKGMAPGPVSQPAADPVTGRARDKGKMHGEMVSLHIELAAYFRRPNFVPPVQQ